MPLTLKSFIPLAVLSVILCCVWIVGWQMIVRGVITIPMSTNQNEAQSTEANVGLGVSVDFIVFRCGIVPVFSSKMGDLTRFHSYFVWGLFLLNIVGNIWFGKLNLRKCNLISGFVVLALAYVVFNTLIFAGNLFITNLSDIAVSIVAGIIGASQLFLGYLYVAGLFLTILLCVRIKKGG